MDDRYIELIVNKCTNLINNKVLFINYNKEIKPFIDKLVSYVKKMGVNDIYLEENDMYFIHDFLRDNSLDDISSSGCFDSSVWDLYARRGASFLLFETEMPHLMDDIPSSKISLMSKIKRETKPLYRSLQEKCKLAWCIVAYPGNLWACDIFKNDNDAYSKLKNYIFDICMLNRDNYLEEWDKLFLKNSKVIDNLNGLDLERLHYSNSLGTDLDIYLPSNYLYSSAKDDLCIVNMPSYEVFTSPIYNKTEGIVYSSKPLIYNGKEIDGFWIKFAGGKVVDYDAKVGKDVLGEIIFSDSYSCYLGEAALVEVDSPISMLNINFGTTLIDENASCHLALGAGFSECIKNGIDMSSSELKKCGINQSRQHVDFMIGTDDLCVIGYTRDGRCISIFKNGKFSLEVL